MPSAIETVRDYYSGTVARHGPTPLGVDWPSAASQYLRFVQLLKICNFAKPFSLNDLGCGYGALLGYLELRHPGAPIVYHGVDVSPQMIEAARSLWLRRKPLARFSIGSECTSPADYSIASGIFNVRLDCPTDAWEAYIGSVLRGLREKSKIGFSVNFMLPTKTVSEARLYGTPPERWIEFCERELACSTEQVAPYGLYEFTLLARV